MAGSPKCLVRIGSETLLERAVRLLREQGVTRLVIATGYRRELVRAALLGAPVKVVECYNPDFATTQNAVSFALCRGALEGMSFFKLDGDVLFSAPLLQRLAESASDLAIAVDTVHPLDAEAMKVRLAADGAVLAFGKHLPCTPECGEAVGIERIDESISNRLFEHLSRASAEGRRDIYYEQIYAELVAAGQAQAGAVRVGDLPWAELDTPEDIRFARDLEHSAALAPALRDPP